jgi:ubiquinone/menaquinone biosynthesis C-methylase UbiE
MKEGNFWMSTGDPNARKESEQRAYFDAAAPVYEHGFFTPTGGARVRRCRALASLAKPEGPGRRFRLLEVGSGTGIYTALLNTLGAGLAVGTDISGAMLRQARGNLGDASPPLVQCSVGVLPFGPGSFDLAIAFACLHHVPRADEAFAEISRVLVDGGRLLMMEPNPLHPLNAALGFLKRVERGVLRSWPSRWRRAAERNSLVLEKMKYGSFFPGRPRWLEPFYAAAEPRLEAIPLIRRIAIFVYYSFRKEEHG